MFSSFHFTLLEMRPSFAIVTTGCSVYFETIFVDLFFFSNWFRSHESHINVSHKDCTCCHNNQILYRRMFCDKTLDNLDEVILTFFKTSMFAGTTGNELFRLFLHTIVFWPQTYVTDTSIISASMLKVSAIKSENS